MIYPPLAVQTKTRINGEHHHNTVFFNTIAWDLHPHASPEGPVTAPSEKCQRRSTARPLGAAMRLTASHQSPKVTPGPRNPRHKKRRPISNDQHPALLCYCKHNSTEMGKCGKAGQYVASQGKTVRAPHNTQHPTKTHYRRMTNDETRLRNGGRQNGWPPPPP